MSQYSVSSQSVWSLHLSIVVGGTAVVLAVVVVVVVVGVGEVVSTVVSGAGVVGCGSRLQ